MRLRPLTLCLLLALAGSTPAQQTNSVALSAGAPQSADVSGPSPDARAFYDQLQALRLDADHVYRVQNIRLRRGPMNLTLTEGQLAFYAPFQGRIIGAVFTGSGRVTLVPREPSEKLSLRHFLGVPLLEQTFTRVYFRFTDKTAAELDQQITRQGIQPVPDSAFVAPWDAILPELNAWHSLRVLSDSLAAQPRPYFYAGISGGAAGPFDVLIDPRREEPTLVGQPRLVEGGRLYDVWASIPSASPSQSATGDFQPLSYNVSATIHNDRSLDGSTTLQLRAHRDGERVLALALARELQVQQITGGSGAPLLFFPGAEFDTRGNAYSGSGLVLVVLNQRVHSGEEFALHVSYRGTVIADAGNGVLFVRERGSWYAHLPGPDRFVPFDLTFRWPRQYTLVATGKKLDERVDGDARVGHWTTPEPIAVAGFNLGDYVRQTIKGAGIELDVYANRKLEEAIADRLRTLPNSLSAGDSIPPGLYLNPDSEPQIVVAPPPPSPAMILSQLGKHVLDSISYLEKWNGAFPFSSLAVSQIPGSFGQGWPGLVYLSTLAFLPQQAQQQAGVAPRVQQQMNELIPYHEIAHQWWGNVVGAASYRDTWILEAVANYLALLYSENRKPSDHVMENFLDHSRQQLSAAAPGFDGPLEQMGPLSLGYRLASADDSGAYEAIVYGKGTWVIHMLRMMLRDSAPLKSGANPADTQNPDARFAAILRDLLTQYRFQPISTADLQRVVENHMTTAMDIQGAHSMDWFFEEWVEETGLPSYSVDFQTRPAANHFQIRGTLHQDGVSESFAMPVPLYAVGSKEKSAYIGTVAATGPETKFQLSCPFRPAGVVADPQHTILSLSPVK